jgi:hypothetical protein
MRSRQWVYRLLTVAAIGLSLGWAALPGSAAETGAPGGSRASAAWTAAAQPASLVTDSGSHLRTKQGLPAPAMSGSMLSANADKQAAARAFVSATHSKGFSPAKCTRQSCRSSLPAGRDLRATQQAQVTNYFCGPATVSEMLAQMGAKVSQRTAARQLKTTTNGTDWSNPGGYPVPKVLNSHQHRNNYVAVALPWSPTKAQVKTFEIDLVTDINHNGGVPLAGNAYEVPGGPHLVGHPVNQTIFHWFDIRGYRKSGATADYEDSVHGASNIGWAATVPAYSSLPSKTIVSIIGARGYAW